MKINNFGKYEEYIEKRGEVLHILNDFDFDLVFLATTTTEHRYQFVIKKYGKIETFDYSEGIGHNVLNKYNKIDKLVNALWCVLTDYNISEGYPDIAEFLNEFGYAEKLNEGIETFTVLKSEKRKLLEIFTKYELEFLTDNIKM